MRRDGFTLLELMIVIALIAIIAAIAVPNLREARTTANETSALAAMRSLHAAQNVYREMDADGNGTLDYANNIQLLLDANLVNMRVGSKISGYNGVEILGSTLYTWSVDCAPEVPGVSGNRYFFVNHTGTMRYSTNQDAAYADWPPVGR